MGDFSINDQESIPDPPFTHQEFTFPTVYSGMSPTHLFELFFDDEVIKLLITESLNYAVYRGFTNTNLSTDEIKCFVGILIMSGYNTLHGRRFYWDTSPDMQNIIVRDCMRRDRFEEICRILHCADYYQFMGGTDLMDENVNKYRIGLRGKKWWWCLFTWLIDVSIQNAWILQKKSGGSLSQLEFRRDIVKTFDYLQKFAKMTRTFS